MNQVQEKLNERNRDVSAFALMRNWVSEGRQRKKALRKAKRLELREKNIAMREMMKK
ncbi:MAG: hypothetical protein IK099_09380 [Clostridia bacterium]|nr:hypothetical protein [Clostridia bacterium]